MLAQTRALGGELDITSEPGAGTLVRMTLPVDASFAAPALAIAS